MTVLSRILLVFHFLGLAIGLSANFANAVVYRLGSNATPPDKLVLGRVTPVMARIGDIGLILLWVTGVSLVYVKYGGFASMPWTFHVKLAAVVLLSATVGAIHMSMAKARRGDTAAAARMPIFGAIALILAIVAIVFAVLTFA